MTDRPRASAPGALAIWAGLLVLYVAWGSTYLAIRYALEAFPPYLLVTLRFLVAGAILLAWNAATGALRRQPPSRREWRDSAIVGALLLCGGMGFVALAEQTVPSGIVALVAGLIPAWTTILGRLVFGERVERLVALGIAVGFAGVAILVGPSAIDALSGTGGGGTAGGAAAGGAAAGGGPALDPVGAALMLIAPILWSSGSLFAAHRARLPAIPTMASAAQMLTGAAIAFAISLLIGDVARFDPARLTVSAVAALLYLATIGGVLAFGTYVWLIRVAPLPKVTTYAYVNPVLAFILGAVMLAEPVSPTTVVAGTVIVIGVALIVTGRGRGAPARERDALLEEAAMAEAEGAGGARPGGLSSRR